MTNSIMSEFERFDFFAFGHFLDFALTKLFQNFLLDTISSKKSKFAKKRKNDMSATSFQKELESLANPQPSEIHPDVEDLADGNSEEVDDFQ